MCWKNKTIQFHCQFTHHSAHPHDHTNIKSIKIVPLAAAVSFRMNAIHSIGVVKNWRQPSKTDSESELCALFIATYDAQFCASYSSIKFHCLAKANRHTKHKTHTHIWQKITKHMHTVTRTHTNQVSDLRRFGRRRENQTKRAVASTSCICVCVIHIGTHSNMSTYEIDAFVGSTNERNQREKQHTNTRTLISDAAQPLGEKRCNIT